MIKRIIQQDRSHINARNVHTVRERSRPEEGQACQPEGPATKTGKPMVVFFNIPIKVLPAGDN